MSGQFLRDNRNLPHTTRRSLLVLTCLAMLLPVLAACDVPNEDRVSRDFAELFAQEAGAGVQPEILWIGPGEGDSGTVYQHVRFDVVALEDVDFRTGWLARHALEKGQKLVNGEAVMLYQDLGATEWEMTWHELDRPPQLPP